MLLLVGGADLVHFRLRVAQSHVRNDLAPSFWSHVAIIRDDGDGLRLDEVALDPPAGFRDVPRRNGVQAGDIARYDDPERFPNIGLLRFPTDAGGRDQRQTIGEAVERVRRERGALDMPNLILPWLGFVWGAGTSGNPLLAGTGIPSAVFAEAAFAALGVELTPGLSTRSSCPEAIWQAALWWHRFYADQGAAETGASGGDAPLTPSGTYWTAQPQAALTVE
jgi:hypothetical protein